MPSYKRKTDFFESEEGHKVIQMLRDMVDDKSYNTNASYSANSTRYPDNEIPFINKHIEYLKSHPSTDPQHYLANLRLMSRIR